MPFGNGHFSEKHKEQIDISCKKIKTKNITFKNLDYLDAINIDDLNEDDFVYCDPPYLNTTAIYNEQRAYGGWNIDNDYELFNLLEQLDKKGIKWGLSNVFENKGIRNEHLIEWCEKHNWQVHHLNHNYAALGKGNAKTDEVYICNYKEDTSSTRNNVVDIYNTDKKYNIIYADPPWRFQVWSRDTGLGRSADIHYNTMEKEDIQNLPIQNICADDCALFLWVTAPCLIEGIELLKKWGFEYKTFGFTWIKTNKKSDSLFWGMGYYTRANAEICLLATKGKPLPRISKSVHQVVMSKIREHSRKPDEVRERIVELFGDISRIELFARQQVDGWDCWGNEV